MRSGPSIVRSPWPPRPAVAGRAASRSRRLLDQVSADRPEDLGPRPERSRQRPGDLRPADASPVGDRHLADAQPALERLDLHLDRPAEVAVGHAETAQPPKSRRCWRCPRPPPLPRGLREWRRARAAAPTPRYGPG